MSDIRGNYLYNVCEEVEIPNNLKNCFRFPSTYIEKNIYDNKHNYDLERFSISYFKTKIKPPLHNLYYNKREFYIDCLNFFLLFYEDIPVAMIGFEIYDDEKIVSIEQIQGIREVNKEKTKNENFHISFFYWQKVLVKYVEIYFGFKGFKEIRIQKAKNNHWLKRSGPYQKLISQFRVNYDEVAINMKYKGKFNPIRTSFYKRL